jgi:hypothetical protein
MTVKVSGLSTSVIAVIAVCGIAGLIVLLVVIAVVMDYSRRMKRKNNTGIMAEEESGKKSLDINEVEKGSVGVSTTEISVKSQSSHYQSTQATRPASPECQCEHPSITVHPPQV